MNSSIYSLYSFIHSFIHLYQHILYFWLQSSTTLFIFVAQVITALAIGSTYSWFPFHWHIPLIVFLYYFVLSTSLLPGLHNSAGSSCIFPALVLESAMYPRNSNAFNGKMVSETKIWVLGMFIATGLSFVRSFQLTEQRDICICTKLGTYTNITISIIS